MCIVVHVYWAGKLLLPSLEVLIIDGQTAGTAILTKIYNDKGWKPTGGTAVGFACAPILILLLRSVHSFS
jgi:uncharacterized membrane-anchored protein YitT (DUF2179 family)